jgi:hypothetical protein
MAEAPALAEVMRRKAFATATTTGTAGFERRRSMCQSARREWKIVVGGFCKAQSCFATNIKIERARFSRTGPEMENDLAPIQCPVYGFYGGMTPEPLQQFLRQPSR